MMTILFGVVGSVLGTLVLKPLSATWRFLLRLMGIPQRYVRFYESRSELNKDRGGLESELQDADACLAAWYVGTYAANNEIFKSGRFQRLVLLHPSGSEVRQLAPLVNRTAQELSTDIRTTTRIAIESHVQVRWLDGPLTNMVIANPQSDAAWARIEVLLTLTADRPSFIVTKSQRPELFASLQQVFEAMWKMAEPADSQID